MCLDNLWITLEHDRGINTPSQVHDLACVKMGSSRLDQGIDRSEGEGIEVTRDERKIFTVLGVCLRRRSGERLDGVWPGDVCWRSRPCWPCPDATDIRIGVVRCDTLTSGSFDPWISTLLESWCQW